MFIWLLLFASCCLADDVVVKLVIDEMTLAPDGFARKVRAFNGQIPGPVIRGKKGDRFIITVVNRLPDSSSVHWHGVEQQGLGVYADGVPMLTQWFAFFNFQFFFPF